MTKEHIHYIMKKFFTNNLFLLILTLPIAWSAAGQSSIRNQRGQNRQTTAQPQQRQTAAQAVQPQRPVIEDAEQTQSPIETQQQTTAPDRRSRLQQQQSQPKKNNDLTERARIRNEENSKAPQHVVWLREIYRVINLDSANNAALKFPIQPIGDRVNLFTLIFRLMQENKIEAYNYEADREADFSEQGRAKFEDILTKNQIPFTVENAGANRTIKVEDIDIPGSDVTEYLIKEGWLFDEATGKFNSQVIAICPTIVSIDYNDNTTHKTNFCWIPYENIRPYLQRTAVMTSDYNNAMTYTLDDFFVKKMYQGDILKTVNMKNLTLAQQVGAEPDVLRRAQDSIEAQLKGFEQHLWVQPDTTATVAGKGKKTTAKTSRQVKPAAKATKQDEKPSGTGTSRSVRRKK